MVGLDAMPPLFSRNHAILILFYVGGRRIEVYIPFFVLLRKTTELAFNSSYCSPCTFASFLGDRMVPE